MLATVDDGLFERHLAPPGHPEHAGRLVAARRGIARSGVESAALAPRDATWEELRRVHSHSYLEELQGIAGRAGYLDSDTFYSPESYAAALRASGGLVALVEALFSREHAYGFALVRPPGHHAGAERSMGFCMLNHVAVAAEHARSLGAERVAIVDWDVHHGNGTEQIFEAAPDVLNISLHQSPHYPGGGQASVVGEGAGVGKNVNIPLSAGAGDHVYGAAFEQLVCPILSQFKPDFIVVSAGYDAHQRDPLGDMALTEGGYRSLSAALCRVLPEHGRHRLIFALEGGYDLQGIEEGVAGTCQALLAAEVFVPGAEVAEPWRSELRRARAIQAQFWELPAIS